MARILVFCLGVYWVNTKGKPDPKARIITPNHVSFFDPLYMYATYQPSFVAKKDVVNIPVFGSLFTAIQPILVDRLSPTSRADTGNEIHRRAHWNEEGTWNPTVIFPEGTCTNGTALIAFKYGAFRPGIPVQPV